MISGPGVPKLAEEPSQEHYPFINEELTSVIVDEAGVMGAEPFFVILITKLPAPPIPISAAGSRVWRANTLTAP